MRPKTENIINEAWSILAGYHPMTLRQVFYRLVAAQVIENRQNNYKSLSRALVTARQNGDIPWEWIEDRLRKPRAVGMWADLADFADTAIKAYRRDVWKDQECYLEAWLEKDALSGIFERVLRPYGVTLNVGRGYDSWSSIRAAAERYGNGDKVSVIYFGDFDPSGEDMVRSLTDRLEFFDCWPTIDKVAVTWHQIKDYALPPNPAKLSDSRAPGFIAEHGDNCVELDALPPDALEDIAVAEVEAYMDLDALTDTKITEKRDLERLAGFLSQPGGAKEEDD